MRYSVFMLLISISLQLQAQQLTQNIRGVVVDAFTEQPLPGTNVTLLNIENKGAATDIDGNFSILDVPIGRISIAFSFIGFKPVVLRNIQLNSGKELFLNIKMEEDVETLESIVVTDEVGNQEKHKPKNELATVSSRSFTPSETVKYAGSLGDPGTMASNFAGVNGTSSDRNDIVIRGNSPAFVLWRMHGLNIPNPNHFAALGTSGGAVGILNNNLLDNSDFLTGAFPAEYGNAIGGVFDIAMRNGNKNKFEFLGQMGFNGVELGAEGPIGKRGSFIANYRYSTLAVFEALGLGAALQGAVPVFTDASFKVDLPTNSAGRFAFFGVAGNSSIDLLEKNKDLEPDSDLGTPDNTDVKFGTGLAFLGMEHVYFLDKNTTLTTSLGWSGELADRSIDTLDSRNNNDRTFFNFQENKTTKVSFNTQLKKKFSATKNLSFGFIADIFSTSFVDSAKREAFTDSSFTAIRADVSKNGIALLQPYIQWKQYLSSKVSYYLGLNAEYFSLNQDFALEPRAGFIYEPNAKNRFSIAYGLHSQIQALPLYFINEVEDGRIITKESNKALKFTRAHHAVVGYDLTISDNVRLKTEAYYQYLFNVPVEIEKSNYSVLNVGASFNETFQPNLDNDGFGRNYGLELTLERFLSDNYYYLLTTSLFSAEYKGSDGVWRNSAFNNNYVINALAGYEIPFNDRMSLDLNIRFNTAGGKRMLDVNEEKTNAAGFLVYNDENAYKKQFDAYLRLDFKVGFFWNTAKGFSQQWSVDLQNVTNRRNIFSQRYDIKSQSAKTTLLRGLFPVFTYRALF